MENSIISKIKNIRELKNYTQEYMAKQLGLTQSGYNKIEKGKTVLGFDKLVKIADILDISVEDIFNFDCQKILSLNSVGNKGNDTESVATYKAINLHTFYETKIIFLEGLLEEKQAMLNLYQEKFGKI